MSDFLKSYGDNQVISDEIRNATRNASAEELLIAIEVNTGQNTRRGIFKAELERRQRIKQDEILSEQLKISRNAGNAALWSAVATGFATFISLVSLIIAIINLSGCT